MRTCGISRDKIFVTSKVAAEHMKSNSNLDFTISNEDMEILKNIEPIKDYGKSGVFPVFGGKLK